MRTEHSGIYLQSGSFGGNNCGNPWVRVSAVDEEKFPIVLIITRQPSWWWSLVTPFTRDKVWHQRPSHYTGKVNRRKHYGRTDRRRDRQRDRQRETYVVKPFWFLHCNLWLMATQLSQTPIINRTWLKVYTRGHQPYLLKGQDFLDRHLVAGHSNSMKQKSHFRLTLESGHGPDWTVCQARFGP